MASLSLYFFLVLFEFKTLTVCHSGRLWRASKVLHINCPVDWKVHYNNRVPGHICLFGGREAVTTALEKAYRYMEQILTGLWQCRGSGCGYLGECGCWQLSRVGMGSTAVKSPNFWVRPTWVQFLTLPSSSYIHFRHVNEAAWASVFSSVKWGQ